MSGRSQGCGDRHTSDDHRLNMSKLIRISSQSLDNTNGAERFEDLPQEGLPVGWCVGIRKKGGDGHASLGNRRSGC